MNFERNPALSRMGRMWLTDGYVRSTCFPRILAAASFVPVKVEHHYARARFEYVGFSPMFRELEQSEPIPTYSLHCKETDEGGIEIYQVYEE